MPDMGLTEILAIIGTAASVGGTAYQAVAQNNAQQDAMNAQRRAQQQQQQQALMQRRREMMAEGPSLQERIGAGLTPQNQQATLSELTGNPAGLFAGGAPGGLGSTGSLTPAIESLFGQGGGAPSLTEPWPQNMV